MTADQQRGAASVEAVLLTPLIVVCLLFVVFVGRISTVESDVHSAARDAARAASLRNDPAAAAADATDVASSVLDGRGVACADLEVVVDDLHFRPGGSVAVDIECVVQLADVTRLGVPGSKTITARSVAVIDTFRGGGR